MPKRENRSMWVAGIGDADDAVEIVDEAGKQARKVRGLVDPLLPSEAEIREHKLTHLPLRNWCPQCIRGRGKEMNHSKQDRIEQGIDEFHLGYSFPGDEFGFKLVILVLVEKYSGMKASVVVPKKGSTGSFAARRAIELIDECGNGDADIILKSDQEPAIKFLVDDIMKKRTGAKTILEESPKKSSGSNGVVVRAVQTVEGFTRSLKSQLDERYMTRISAEYPIVIWMCDYASYLLTRLGVGRDGKTATERSKGKKASVLGVDFGEKVMWKGRPAGAMQKLEPRWEYGIFIGVRRRRSGEVYVATEGKMIKTARKIRRVPEEDRWAIANLDLVRHVPWNLGNDDKEADGLASEFDFKNGPGARMTAEEVENIASKGPSGREPHPAHLSKKGFEEHGCTDRYPGCSTILRGMRLQPHTIQCRKRMADILEGDARIENMRTRIADHQRSEEPNGSKKRSLLD